MKTTAAIFALTLISTALSWGQGIETYHSDSVLVKQKAELDSLDSTWIDLYAGKTDVDDGFGGIWSIRDEGLLVRPMNRQPGRLAAGNLRVDLLLSEKSRPIEEGLYRAFYGYVRELQKSSGNKSFYVWIDPATGKINEVGYNIWGSLSRAIPPECYTRYERFLKDSVSFDVSHMRYSRFDSVRNFCYIYYASFKKIVTAEDEPSYLSPLPEPADDGKYRFSMTFPKSIYGNIPVEFRDESRKPISFAEAGNVNHYEGNTSVDDSIGDTWNVKVVSNPSVELYLLERGSNQFTDVQYRRYLDYRRFFHMYVRSSIIAAFGQHLDRLRDLNSNLHVELWINPRSGWIEEVCFSFATSSELAKVSPEEFAACEQTLKKLVRFERGVWPFPQAYYKTMSVAFGKFERVGDSGDPFKDWNVPSDAIIGD